MIWKLDRLGRSLSHLVQTVKDLEQRGVNRETDAPALAGELGVTRQTLYRHVGPGGELRADGQKLMGSARRERDEGA